MNRNARLNRSLSPFSSDHQHNSSNLNISPQCYSRGTFLFDQNIVNYKQNDNTNTDSHMIPGNTKDFFESSPISTDYQVGRKKRNSEEDYALMTLNQINLELDNNSMIYVIYEVNEVIFLFGKRKNLMAAKKKKLRDDTQAKLAYARNKQTLDDFPYSNDKEFLKIVEFASSTRTAVNLLTRLTQILPNLEDPNQEQKEKSEIFWERNRQLQNQIDQLLYKLKTTDKSLQKQNTQVHQICKQLDRIEGSLKSFVGTRAGQNVQRVQPLFQAKKKKYDVLNRKIKAIDYCKDTKIQFIKKIKRVLQELLSIREKRLREIANFFGLDNFTDFSQLDFKNQGDFTNGFEDLLKIKQKQDYLQSAQGQVRSQIQTLQRQQQRLYNELLKNQSDEAKAYHSFNDIVNQRVKYTSILSLFGAQTQSKTIFDCDQKQLARRFKDYKGVIKIFLQQQNSLRQGLSKTLQTSKTFSNLLTSTQNQKQRRYQLLSILQTCIKRRHQYQQKKQQLRTIGFEQNRIQQQLTQCQEELETVLTDGDIDNYKQIGQVIGNCEKEKTRLMLLKEKVEKDMEHMDQEVISLANRVKLEYEDILCDIVPADYQYSLKTGEDVKKLRNHLRKMYKRLGILSHQSN